MRWFVSFAEHSCSVNAETPNAVFQGLTVPKHFDGVSKHIAQLITSATPPNMQMKGSIGLKGRVCTWVKLSLPGVYFVIFLGPMLIATGRPVEPINAVNGSHDASWWHSHLYVVRIIKLI